LWRAEFWNWAENEKQGLVFSAQLSPPSVKLVRFTNLTDGGDIGKDSIDSSMADSDTINQYKSIEVVNRLFES